MSELNIERISSIKDIQKIRGLFEDYNFKPYYFLRKLKTTDTNKLFLKRVSDIVSDKSNFIFTAARRNRYAGFIILEKQKWDTSFFGFPCYKIECMHVIGNKNMQLDLKKNLLKYLFSLAKEKGIRYLNIKLDTQDNTGISAVESCGFSLMAIMLNFIYSVSCHRQHFKALGKIRPYRSTDLSVLSQIAKSSMRYDHFHTDSNFSKKTSDNIYASLIENCCKGILSDKVFVIERKEKVVGYVACEIKHQINKILPLRIGHIRHLATSFSEGFGCGHGLQEAALKWFEDKVDIVESNASIQNLPIIKLSIKSGMDISSSYLVFSKWLKE